MTGADPISLGLVVVGVLTGALGVYAWRERSTPGALPFAVLMGGVTVWEFGYALQLLSSTTAQRLFWLKVQWVAVVVIPVAWLLFALDYTGHDRWITPGTVGVLSVEPVVLTVLVWTTDYHDLLRVVPHLGATGTASVWGVVQGPAFVYHLTYAYVTLFLGTAILVQLMRTTPQVYRDTTTALLVGIGVPWGANVAYWLQFVPTGGDPTALGFAVSGVTFGWVLFEQRLFDVLPVTPEVAHKELVDEMSDGVVTVDRNGRVIDHNRAAARLMDLETASDGEGTGLVDRSVAGKRVDAVLPGTAAEVVDRALSTADHADREAVLQTGDQKRYFEVTAEPLSRHDQTTGALVTLHDIHDRVLREQRLNVLNRVLRHNLRHQSNLIYGHAERIRLAHEETDPDQVDVEDVLGRAESLKGSAHQLERWSQQARDIEQMLESDDGIRSPIDLVPVVEEVVAEVRGTYPEADITTHLPEQATVAAHDSLEEAITELLENAIQHNDGDAPTVGVELDASEDSVELAVVDDGPGIPEQERRVLDGEEETDLHHGSGLGLWLVNWAVRASGGEVDLDHAGTAGSEVRIDLPRADAGTA